MAPPGSLNNELGYPYTALRADATTRYLVLELGARGAGHISYLCDIVPPRVGVVINVGVAHVGEFGSVEAIAAAKSELVEALPPTESRCSTPTTPGWRRWRTGPGPGWYGSARPPTLTYGPPR